MEHGVYLVFTTEYQIGLHMRDVRKNLLAVSDLIIDEYYLGRVVFKCITQEMLKDLDDKEHAHIHVRSILK